MEEAHEEAIAQFCGVTGADEERARYYLEACDWNLELAINMHVDTDDGRAGNKPSTSNAATGVGVDSGGGPSTSSASTGGPRVITIPDNSIIVDEDEDDDEDVKKIAEIPSGRPAQMPRRAGQPVLNRNSSNRITPNPSPLYDNDSDHVRPPIPPVRQVLVSHTSGDYSSDPMMSNHVPGRVYGIARRGRAVSNSRDILDPFRDFQAETEFLEMMATEAANKEGGSSDSTGGGAVSSDAAVLSRRTLQELYRPPLELQYNGTLTTAREQGTSKNKWLIVNIQDIREFACQTLNRDVWSNQTVRDILREHFIFWQVHHDSYEGSRFIQFYHVRKFPHVSIIDPRTGENMKSWPPTIDHSSFCDSVIEFLTEHPSPDGSSDAKTMKKLRFKEDFATTLYDQSEEAQLEAAIKASLQETEDSNSSKAFADEDSFTDGIESDTDQTTQSSFQANTSSHKSASTFCNNSSSTSNGQTSNVNVKSEFGENLMNAVCPRIQPVVNNIKIENDADTKEELSEEIEDYKEYLGVDNDKFSDLIIRFPDGTRDQIKFPSDSKMNALFLLLTSKGYGMNRYNYVTNFPRRLLHELPSTDTLQDAKLIRETIFVERRVKDE